MIQNQVESYPNTYEAPTSEKQIEKNKFEFPLFSQSLDELDPTRKIDKEIFIQTAKYSKYKLTRGEMYQIFTFIDIDHNDSIETLEWEKFVTLFVRPFEACNKSKDNSFPSYLLDLQEFTKCFDADPRSKFIEFRRRDIGYNHYEMIMQTISTRGESKLNFFEYFFLRRALFGWSKCHSHRKFIANSSFNCAFKYTVPNKLLMKKDLKAIYLAGLKFQYKDSSMIELDFISFLRISFYSYHFFQYSRSTDMSYIEKSQFLKAVKEDILPMNFDNSEVESFYQLTDTRRDGKKDYLNFESFCFFFHLHRLFNKYSLERPLLLTQTEFLNLLEDKLFPVKIILGIDSSFNNFSEKDYLEASLVLQKQRTNEKKFFFSFKQDASERTEHNNYIKTSYNSYYDTEKLKNIPNRKVLFKIFSEKDGDVVTKKSFYKAFQLANLFSELAENSFEFFEEDKRPLIPQISSSFLLKKLPRYYDMVNPPVSIDQRRNYKVYKIFPNEIYLDMLTFLSVENFPYQILMYTGKFSHMIDETILKIVIGKLGMENMPDSVLETARKGYDKLRRRVYFTRKAANNILFTHAIASEQMRTKKYFITNNLIENKEISRLLPQSKRRFVSSPLVK